MVEPVNTAIVPLWRYSAAFADYSMRDLELIGRLWNTRVFRGPLRLTGPDMEDQVGKDAEQGNCWVVLCGLGVDVDSLRSSKQNKSKQPRRL